MKFMAWVFCTVFLAKLLIAFDQNKDYRIYIAQIEWSLDTLKLNVAAERELMWRWKACAKYGWCRGLKNYSPWQKLRTEPWEFRG